jgi:uncharacterized protein YjbK
MEIVLRIRTFDTNFYAALKSAPTKAAREIEQNVVRAEKTNVSLEDQFDG